MGKGIIIIISFLFLGSIMVQAGFGDINVGKNNTNSNNTKINSTIIKDADKISTLITNTHENRDKGVAEIKYTLYFYIAIGLGFIIIILFIYFLYRLIVGPYVKWNNPKPLKH